MNTNRLTIIVLMGGKSEEYDISLLSGEMVVNGLRKNCYCVVPVIVTRDGAWCFGEHCDEGKAYFSANDLEASAHKIATGRAIQKLIQENPAAVFLAMHGPYGEDGTIQGLLELLEVPYTGSDLAASSLAINKLRCKEIFIHHNIATPTYVKACGNKWRQYPDSIREEIELALGYPCILKPPSSGSSIGLKIISNEKDLREGLDLLFDTEDVVLIEEYITGREISCPVISDPENASRIALPLIEILPQKSKYFDYQAKYTPGATLEIIPARIDPVLTKKAKEIGVRVHEILGCGDMSRSDMIIRNAEVFVLETNTIPGLTKTSLLPQSAKAYGIDFPELLDLIIHSALVRHQRKKKKHLEMEEITC